MGALEQAERGGRVHRCVPQPLGAVGGHLGVHLRLERDVRGESVRHVADKRLSLHLLAQQRLVVEILEGSHDGVGVVPGVRVDGVGEPRVVAEELDDGVSPARERGDGVEIHLGGDHGEVDPADQARELSLVVHFGDGEDDDLAGDGLRLALAEPRGAVGVAEGGGGGEENVGSSVPVAGDFTPRVRVLAHVEVNLERVANLVEVEHLREGVGDDDTGDDDEVRVHVRDVVVDHPRLLDALGAGDNLRESREELLAHVPTLDVHGNLDGDPHVAALAAGVVMGGLALADRGDRVSLSPAVEPRHGESGGAGGVLLVVVCVVILGNLRREHRGLHEALLAARSLNVTARGRPREDILDRWGGTVDVLDDVLDSGVVPEEGELPSRRARDREGGGELRQVVELALQRVGGVVHLLRESHELVLVVDAKDGEGKLNPFDGTRRVVKVGQVELGVTLVNAGRSRGHGGADEVRVDVGVLEVLELLPRAAADDAVNLVAVDGEIRGDGVANLGVVVGEVLGVEERELDASHEGILHVERVDVVHLDVIERGVVGENLRDGVADVVLVGILVLDHERRLHGDDDVVLVTRERLPHLGHDRLGVGRLRHGPAHRGVRGGELLADLRHGVRRGGAEILNLANHALAGDALGDDVARGRRDELLDDGIDDEDVGRANRKGEHRLVTQKRHLGSNRLAGGSLGELLHRLELGAAAAVADVNLIGVKVRLGAHLSRSLVEVFRVGDTEDGEGELDALLAAAGILRDGSECGGLALVVLLDDVRGLEGTVAEWRAELLGEGDDVGGGALHVHAEDADVGGDGFAHGVLVNLVGGDAREDEAAH